ncbi:MAG: TonB-dependent receptor [Gemmatimonadetes bacterium]|nr:TonB-dependent receptor [Gemmatimonadota bacterium]
MNARALALLIAACAAAPAAAQDAPLVRLDTIRVDVVSRIAAGFPARSRVVQVLTADQLRALPVRSVADALRWMTATDVQARSPAQADLSLRGSTFEQVLVLVDGVRVSDPQTGHFDLDLAVPMDRVERIELLEGPASALYGADAMGGVVNVVTRDGGSGLSVRGERGTFDTWRAAGSLDGQVAGVQAGASAEWDDSDGHRAGTEYETLQLHGRLSAPTMGGRLFAQAGHARRDFGANGFYAPRDSYEETRTTTVSAGWSGEVGGGFTLRPLLSFRRHADDFTLIRTNPAIYENVHVSRQRGGELLARRRGSGALALALGGELYRDDLESDNVATGRPALGARAEVRGAGFVELGWAAGRTTASAGLRGDWHEGFGDAWSPSLSASADLTPSLRARGGWGRSFRAPTWTERFYQDPTSIGDPDLQPESSWTAELGLDLALPRTGLLRATAFRRQSDDLIDWVKPAGSPASAPSTIRNVESARFDGLELALEGLSIEGFGLDAAASWLSLDAGEASGLVSRYALKPIENRVLLGVTRSLLGERLTLSGRWQRERMRVDDDPYQLLGARARVRLPYGELDLIGSNLTDEAHKDITGNPAAGRALSVGYRVELRAGR